MKLLNISELR